VVKRYDIADWETIERSRRWPFLLVGNGASCAVSDCFAYTKLLSVSGLGADDLRLFKALGTVNFEAVLDYLRVAALVCEQVGHDEDDVHLRYERIRDALITAINDHHIAWSAIPVGPLERYRGVLLEHEATWCTSYDLLSYWAVMAESPRGTRGSATAFGPTTGLSIRRTLSRTERCR
jgi:hypothetical protein